MDDFLLDAPKSNYACSSIEDLQLQLGVLRQSKVTGTKAEHISATFEFRSPVVFHVPENENDGADANQKNLDPALGGSSAATPDAPASGNGDGNGNTIPAVRDIRAHDTLMNQPTDDPALQKAVAKHIITSMGTVDGSSWTVRSVSRGASGWAFQYLCKNSTQAWQRQNSKNAAKVLVGESSGKDGQDPVNLARPAFDCRGSVTVAFVKNNRLITVKLEHTPLHKTVADLAELYKPPPPPARAEVARRQDGESKKRKNQAVDGAEDGEEAAKKKRRKKNTNPDDPNAEGEQTPRPSKPRASRAKKKPNGVGAQGDGQRDNALLNLSPSEAARRRDEAVRKLSDNGIDASTLSTEQFDIFSNQSPDLQNESLAMLIKYGAERLRIVHPIKDNPPSPSPAPVSGATPDGTAKKKRSRKKGLNEVGTPKVKKTRGSCQACRAKKLKCSKSKPECAECIEAGLACYYPPQQKRKPTNKSAEVAEDELGEPAAEGPTTTMVPEPEPEPVSEEEASDLGSPGFNSQVADTSTAFPEVSHDSYQPATTGLSYPQAVPDEMASGLDYSTYSTQALQQQSAPSGMAYPHQSQQPSNAAYPEPLSAHPPPASAPAPEPVRPVPAPTQPARPTSSVSGARRSLPSESRPNHSGYSNPAETGNAPDWQTTNVPVSTTQTYSGSPSRQSQSRNRANAPVYEASQQEGLQAAVTLSQAALQKAHPSPNARTVSPFQNPTQAARAKSRQGQRSQSRTTASPFQQTSSTHPAGVDASAIYNSSAAPDSNSLYSRYNTATTQSSQASSRVAYEPYSQQTTSNSSSTSYPSYEAYPPRSQASTSSVLAAPVTQPMSASYTKTADPSPTTWTNSASSRNGTTYSTNNAAATSNSAYNMPVSSTQQQPTTMQSFSVRRQSATHTPRTNTPSSYSAQQHTQQPRQQQQSYNSYPPQSHSSANQQQQQQQQQQQDWYGLNATPGYGSNSRGAGYGHSGSGNGSYSQHRAMNLSGNTYQSMHDQELYDMLRNTPGH